MVEDRDWDLNDPEWTKQLWLQYDPDTDNFRTQLFILYAHILQQCGVTDFGSFSRLWFTISVREAVRGFVQFGSSDDLFFSRLHVGLVRGSLGNPSWTDVNQQQRHVYTQKYVNEVVKACATRCELDPGRFSTKSFKSLGISTLQNNREELKVLEKEAAIFFDHSSVGVKICIIKGRLCIVVSRWRSWRMAN